MVEGFAHVDGRIVPLGEARLPLIDRGYLLGDGVFETLRTHKGRLFQLDPHMERLERGLNLLAVDPTLVEEAAGCLIELVAHATPRLGPDLNLRVQVTSGDYEGLLATRGSYRVTAVARPFEPWPRERYTDGVRLVVSDVKKDTRSPWATVKTLSYFPHVMARKEAVRRGAHDALLLNADGRVCEASTSNVFALLGQVLHAPGPEEGAIDGITRASVLEMARELGLIIETTLSVEELSEADEVFLTNTIAGVVPVADVEERSTKIRQVPGTVTQQLMLGYEERLERV